MHKAGALGVATGVVPWCACATLVRASIVVVNVSIAVGVAIVVMKGKTTSEVVASSASDDRHYLCFTHGQFEVSGLEPSAPDQVVGFPRLWRNRN